MRTILPPYARTIPTQAKRVFEGVIFDVYQWPQELFDGSTATFEMLKRPDTISVMAIKDHRLVVINEEQPSFGRSHYSLPGGRHDVETETELEAGQRELLEETGLVFQDWRLIQIKQPYTKIDWFVYIYLATGYESTSPVKHDAGEKIEVEYVDHAQALELARATKDDYLPRDILEHVASIDELVNLPVYGQ